jgi:hypothetical protein
VVGSIDWECIGKVDKLFGYSIRGIVEEIYIIPRLRDVFEVKERDTKSCIVS